MNRHAPLREHYMLSTEGSALRKLDKATLDMVGKVGELPSQGGVGIKVANSAFNVDPRIHTGCTGCIAQSVVVFFALLKVHGKGFKHQAALREGHGS